MRRLQYTRTALRQIERALDYISLRSPRGAANVSERIRAALGLIEAYPHAGEATTREHVRRLVLTPYPFVIFYRVTPDAIIVQRFRHAARRPVAE